MKQPRLTDRCAKCDFTYDGHLGNLGHVYPCWTPKPEDLARCDDDVPEAAAAPAPVPEAPKLLSAWDMRNDGFLQEANRVFFHPLGLALALDYDPNNVEAPARLSVQDHRADPEGVTFGWDNLSLAEKADRHAKFTKVHTLRLSKAQARMAHFGGTVYPDANIQRLP